MGSGPRHDTRNPRLARTRALKILFQADVRGETGEQALQRLADDPHGRAILDDLDVSREGDAEAEIRAAAEASAEVQRRSRRSGGRAEATDPAGEPPALDGFTRRLVLGVSEHLEEIDALIGRHARRWSVDRMPVVDRSVLRLATYELLHEHTSAAVVINEALELAKALSTEASGRYVNGVLEAVRKDIARARGQERPGA